MQRPADIEVVFKLLTALGLGDAGKTVDDWVWPEAGSRAWIAFSDAMRSLQQQQQQQNLEPGSLLAVRTGLHDLSYQCMYFKALGMHSIHHWASGYGGVMVPLPLLRLLGVDVDVPWYADMAPGGFTSLRAAVGDGVPALALALTPASYWKEDMNETQQQQQRLHNARTLVAAGASYSWEGPAGATVLSLAAGLQEPAFLEALLARPNALQAFTPGQVSVAVVAAAQGMHLNQGCLLLEAVAAAGSIAQAGTPASAPGVMSGSAAAQSVPAAPVFVLTPAAAAAAAKLLVCAIKERNLCMLRRLLVAGADPNVSPSSHDPVLHWLINEDVRGPHLVSCSAYPN
jgi:hypothetical protein